MAVLVVEKVVENFRHFPQRSEARESFQASLFSPLPMGAPRAYPSTPSLSSVAITRQYSSEILRILSSRLSGSGSLRPRNAPRSRSFRRVGL